MQACRNGLLIGFCGGGGVGAISRFVGVHMSVFVLYGGST